MHALLYHCTSSLVGWPEQHVRTPRGYAYDTGTHFVHIYGSAEGLWPISTGLTISMRKEGELEGWVERNFGAQDVQTSMYEVGCAVQGKWRPGIFFDTDMFSGLEQTPYELRLAEQRLLMLLEKLDDILLYMEPTDQSLPAYGHKLRELLILACTDVEAAWKYHLARAGIEKRVLTTNDYVKLKEPLHLEEFEVSFPRYKALPPLMPFRSWVSASPTDSLPWYANYNATKHDGSNNFDRATLLSCIESVAANVVMFAVRFGPHRLFGGGGLLSALTNSLVLVSLKEFNIGTAYVPRVAVEGRGPQLTWGPADTLPPKPQRFAI